MAKVKEGVFWKYLEANGGIFARTAAAITEHEGLSITRQAVRNRALLNKEKYNEILETLKDKAESNVHNLMNDAENESVRLKANIEWLNKMAKDRGWGDTPIEVKPTVNVENKVSLDDIPAETLLAIKKKQKGNIYSDE